MPLTALDDYFTSITRLVSRIQGFNCANNVLRYASKLRAEVVVEGRLNDEILASVEKALNFAKSAEDFKYGRLSSFDGETVRRIVFKRLPGNYHGRYLIGDGIVVLNTNIFSKLSDNELFSLVHHEYMPVSYTHLTLPTN